MKILFLTDIHGNVRSFERALQVGSAEDVDAVILGGDLHPIGFNVTPEDQREFFEENYLEPARSSGLRIMAIMGNVDWKINLKHYRRYHPTPIHWLNIEGGRVGEYQVEGMSHVPITPFAIKDWDAWDGSEGIPDGALLEGMVSTESGVRMMRFAPGEGTPNIEGILEEIRGRVSGEWILVSHCPPYGTSLDMTGRGLHVGSRSLRRFLESTSAPLLSLHGHIHESPLISGKVCERVGRAISCNPGDSRRELRGLVVEVDGGEVRWRRV